MATTPSQNTAQAGATDLVHWRDAARSARFFVVDAYACFPIVLFTLHMRMWTFMMVLFSIAFFGVLERFGFSVPVFMRWARVVIGGKHKPATPWWEEQIQD